MPDERRRTRGSARRVYDPKKLPAIGDKKAGHVHVLMLDGSVRVVKLNKLTEETLRAAITVDGGESSTLP
ncbi:MAG: hypothetical protein FJ304_20205 [Planctomycetes bacterium]|nr:hypothetical protein [Planctomycetota bacterium]